MPGNMYTDNVLCAYRGGSLCMIHKIMREKLDVTPLDIKPVMRYNTFVIVLLFLAKQYFE